MLSRSWPGAGAAKRSTKKAASARPPARNPGARPATRRLTPQWRVVRSSLESMLTVRFIQYGSVAGWIEEEGNTQPIRRIASGQRSERSSAARGLDSPTGFEIEGGLSGTSHPYDVLHRPVAEDRECQLRTELPCARRGTPVTFNL